MPHRPWTKEQIREYVAEGHRLARDVQLLGASTLLHAKTTGDLSLLNEFIDAVPPTFDHTAVIQWVEQHGPVRWNRKKRRFVHARTGTWRLCAAARTPWTGNPKHAIHLKADYDKTPAAPIRHEEVSGADRLSSWEQIQNYLTANPEPDSVGRQGLPQAKFRYGTYGRRDMTLDTWRRHVKTR